MWKRKCLLMMGFYGLVCLLLAGAASTEQLLFSFLFLFRFEAVMPSLWDLNCHVETQTYLHIFSERGNVIDRSQLQYAYLNSYKFWHSMHRYPSFGSFLEVDANLFYNCTHERLHFQVMNPNGRVKDLLPQYLRKYNRKENCRTKGKKKRTAQCFEQFARNPLYGKSQVQGNSHRRPILCSRCSLKSPIVVVGGHIRSSPAPASRHSVFSLLSRGYFVFSILTHHQMPPS